MPTITVTGGDQLKALAERVTAYRAYSKKSIKDVAQKFSYEIAFNLFNDQVKYAPTVNDLLDTLPRKKHWAIAFMKGEHKQESPWYKYRVRDILIARAHSRKYTAVAWKYVANYIKYGLHNRLSQLGGVEVVITDTEVRVVLINATPYAHELMEQHGSLDKALALTNANADVYIRRKMNEAVNLFNLDGKVT